jgi:hypothetical protein
MRTSSAGFGPERSLRAGHHQWRLQGGIFCGDKELGSFASPDAAIAALLDAEVAG